MLQYQALRKLVDYDPATGMLSWRVKRNNIIHERRIVHCTNCKLSSWNSTEINCHNQTETLPGGE